MELERERRADDLALPERRDVAVLDPAAPVAERRFQVAVAQHGQRLLDGRAPAEHEVLAPRQREGAPRGDVVERDVGLEPDGARVPLEAEVRRAAHLARVLLRPTEAWVEARANHGAAAHRLDDAVELRRVENVLDLREAR